MASGIRIPPGVIVTVTACQPLSGTSQSAASGSVCQYLQSKQSIHARLSVALRAQQTHEAHQNVGGLRLRGQTPPLLALNPT